jgi:hypothetical protein
MKGFLQLYSFVSPSSIWKAPFIGGLILKKNNVILIFSAKWNNFRGENIFSNYFDYDQKLEIIIFRR